MVNDGAEGLVGAAKAGDGDLIKDATIETFERDVLEASMQGPVIVDFWATWCEPCKQLTPALEKAVNAAAGAVRLVKVDIDKNQMLASQLRIQSVPTVYGFFQGRPIDGFQGRVPDSEISAFVDRLVAMAGGAVGAEGPPVAELIAAAKAAFEGGDVAGAARVFGEAAQASEPGSDDNANALAGLARCHLSLSELDKAQQIVDLIPDEKRTSADAASVIAALALAANGGGDASGLVAKIEANPDDLDARFELAETLIASGDMSGGLDQLLEITMRDRAWNEEAARNKILTVFEALGPTDPLTLKGRRRLSSILFA